MTKKKVNTERTERRPMKIGCDLVAFGLCDILGNDRKEDDKYRDEQRENLKNIWIRYREMKRPQLKHSGRDYDDHWKSIEKRLLSKDPLDRRNAETEVYEICRVVTEPTGGYFEG